METIERRVGVPKHEVQQVLKSMSEAGRVLQARISHDDGCPRGEGEVGVGTPDSPVHTFGCTCETVDITVWK